MGAGRRGLEGLSLVGAAEMREGGQGADSGAEDGALSLQEGLPSSLARGCIDLCQGACGVPGRPHRRAGQRSGEAHHPSGLCLCLFLTHPRPLGSASHHPGSDWGFSFLGCFAFDAGSSLWALCLQHWIATSGCALCMWSSFLLICHLPEVGGVGMKGSASPETPSLCPRSLSPEMC